MNELAMVLKERTEQKRLRTRSTKVFITSVGLITTTGLHCLLASVSIVSFLKLGVRSVQLGLRQENHGM